MSERLPIEVPMDRIRAFCTTHGVQELSVFGSVLRNDFGPHSDVDVLITLVSGVTMTVEKYLDMCDELSSIFGDRNIDLVQKRLLKNPYRRHEILRTREVLYAA